jgi:multicomponent K+:H+ antiporter subunit A
MLLVVVCIVVGLFPAATFGPLVQVAATALAGHRCPITSWPSGTASTCRCS